MKKKKKSKNTKDPKKIFLKIVCGDGSAPFRRAFKWPLPTKLKQGQWTPFIQYIAECKQGYHFCQDLDSFINWWLGTDKQKRPRIFAAQARIKGMIISKSKIVTKTARLLLELKIPEIDILGRVYLYRQKFKRSIRRQLKRRNMILYGEVHK